MLKKSPSGDWYSFDRDDPVVYVIAKNCGHVYKVLFLYAGMDEPMTYEEFVMPDHGQYAFKARDELAKFINEAVKTRGLPESCASIIFEGERDSG